MWKSTRTLQSLRLGLQMATSTRPNLRRASRQLQAIEDFAVQEDVDVSHRTSHQKQDSVPMRW
eukprot:6638648-Alexandrium_andersonii.AAC.1